MQEVAEAVKRLRAGETLMPLEEVIELLRYAGARKEAYDAMAGRFNELFRGP